MKSGLSDCPLLTIFRVVSRDESVSSEAPSSHGPVSAGIWVENEVIPE
ncbi:hypothetical protein DFJ69_5796 [Thermomonospora umbrina]|uniref:Uncharacterized protein n=1 Tax=Thermomonospora umbrina TaxID=111806 RepID=A0A3D9SWF1_9ACTN|nr:hypothetical protein DFJ69_5796 [Thermomonospora umbrina]